MNTEFSYDVVAYPSFVFPQTSPQKLAAAGILRGMKVELKAGFRYLDMGCGDGANLLLHAFDFPDGEFVGIDLSEPRIREARKHAEELGLKNVTFIFGDVMEFTPAAHGKFDFIIAHGLYSWVPAVVRKRVLEIYGECLAEHGVGYISYNAYPGCHLREMVWNMMRYRVDPTAPAMEQVNDGVRFIAALRENTSNPILRALLDVELEQLIKRNPENIFHDDLSSANQPFYFHEFNRDIEAHALQFLTDIDPLSVSEIALSEKEAAAIDALGGDRIERSQNTDFLNWSRFRNSLICRESAAISDAILPGTLRSLQLFSDVKPANQLLQSADGVIQEFKVTRGGSFSVDRGITKLALDLLGSIHPQSHSIDEIFKTVRDSADTGADITDASFENAERDLESFVDRGIIRCRISSSPHVSDAMEKPTASRFARWQAAKGFDSVTSLAGFNLEFEDKAMLELLQLLDGTRDRAALAREMLPKFDVPENERAAFEKNLPALIESQLTELAKAAYLSA